MYKHDNQIRMCKLILCYDCLVRHKSSGVENTNLIDVVEYSNQHVKDSLDDLSNDPSMCFLYNFYVCVL